jgi:hypothetical protein
MQEKNSDIFETSDLGTAAYLLLKGCALITAGKERNRYSFIFKEEKKCQKLAIEYVNSEFSRFDSSLKGLRNLIK